MSSGHGGSHQLSDARAKRYVQCSTRKIIPHVQICKTIHVSGWTNSSFIRTSHEGLWNLHLASMEELCKYFFAHDRYKYARLVPLLLAEMRNRRI